MPGFASEPIYLRSDLEVSDGLGRLTDVAETTNNTLTKTSHGTGGALTVRVEHGNTAPATADTIPAFGGAFVDQGYRIRPADLGTDDSRVAVTIPSGTWTFYLHLLASVAQAAADTTVTVRVGKRATGGTITELFRKAGAFTVALDSPNLTLTCDSTSTIASGTGSPPAVSLGLNETIQVEIYITAPGVAALTQVISLNEGDTTPANVSRIDLPGLTSIVTEPPLLLSSPATQTQAQAVADTTALNVAATHTQAAATAQTLVLAAIADHAQAEALAAQSDLTGVSTHAADQSLADRVDLLAAATHTQALAIADVTAMTSAVTHALSDSLAQTSNLTSAATHTLSDAIAQTSSLTAVSTHTESEALAETSVLSALAILSAAEALADRNDLTAVAALSTLEALAESPSQLTVTVLTENWRLISPGLSGTFYDATGTTPIPGGQVLVFRNDTHALVATLTTNASGGWATALDPAYLYWVSYHKGVGSTTAVHPDNIGWRTDRHIPTVESEIASGT